MMKIWVVMLVAVIVSGCATSFDTLKDIRRISGDGQAADEQARLLDEFARGGQSAQWRAEAMKTLAHLDFEFMHQTHYPKLHKKLIGLLKREYVTPECERGTPSKDRYRLRGWSIHALALCDRANELKFFADVLEERRSNTDPDFIIRMAALDGILARRKALALDSKIRLQVMSACATLKNEVKPRIALTPAAKSLYNGILELESNLLSYEDSVALLPEKAVDYTDPGQIMQIMSWCERGIVLDKAAETRPKTYEENLRKLVVMATHPKVRIRQRARRMLSIYEPLKLYSLLNKENGGRGIPEANDVLDLLYLAQRLDAVKSPLSEADRKVYTEMRDDAFKAWFAAMEKYPLQTRGAIMSRMVIVDLDLFATLATKHAKTLDAETPKNRHVYAKAIFFGFVKAAGKDQALVDQLVNLLARFANSEYLPTRRLVTHALHQSHPESLIMAKLPMFQALKDWDPVKTDELVDAYMASLLELEKDAERLKRFADEFVKSNGMSVYDPLAMAIGQRVEGTNAKIAEFLRQRAPDTFLNTLAKVMVTAPQKKASQTLREAIMLGDFAMRTQATIKPETLTTVTKTLAAGVRSSDEELAILCARYLLEMGLTLDEATVKKAPLVVKELNALKTEVKK